MNNINKLLGSCWFILFCYVKILIFLVILCSIKYMIIPWKIFIFVSFWFKYTFDGFNGILSLFLDTLNRVYFVLPSSNDSLFVLNQMKVFSNSKFTAWYSCLISLLKKKILSSADITGWRTIELSYKSFSRIRKS